MAKRAIDVKQAEDRLAELVNQANRGKAVFLTHGNESVARSVPIQRTKRARRFSSANGNVMVHPVSNAPLEDFRDCR